MLIIHPADRTTAMLGALYADVPGTRRLDRRASNAEIRHALHHASAAERIMLLGHGSERGLFSRADDTCPDFDRIIVNHSHAYYLRRHAGHIVGIWCHAADFARKEGLHGLFTGMIISEMSEAHEYGVTTTPQELDAENRKLATRLRALFDAGIPLADIPAAMLAAADTSTPLTDFNYRNFHYL